jgi:anti-anti-sigma factor
MEATIEYLGELLLIKISGRLDSHTAPAFETQLAPELAQPRARILVDLGAVTYVSSAGLRSILRLIKHATASGGRVGVFSAAPHIMEVIEISGFPGLIDIYADRDSALATHS